MLYFFYGPDTYRSSRKIKEVIAAYRAKNPTGVNVQVLDYFRPGLQEESSLLPARGSFRTREDGRRGAFAAHNAQSLFPEKLFMLVRGASSLSALPEQLESWIATDNISLRTDMFLVFHEADVPQSNQLVAMAQQYGKIQFFPILAGRELRRFVEGMAQERKVGFEQNALDLFLAKIGGDLWRAEQELEKCFLMCPEKGLIGREVVARFVADAAQDTPDSGGTFRFLDAVAEKRVEDAAHELLAHLERGGSEVQALSSLCWRFRDLICIHDAQTRKQHGESTAASYGMHPFVVKKTSAAVSRWSQEALVLLYRELFAFDFGTKQNALDCVSALVHFVAYIESVGQEGYAGASRTARVLLEEMRHA